MRLVQQYVELLDDVPPFPAALLEEHAKNILSKNHFSLDYAEYVGVLFNNELWKPLLASIPYNKRLLLLPKCLRLENICPAPFDEFGLLCKQCGLCSIQDLQNEAEKLGYAVLVAEGSAVVMKLIESQKIEAIVGVSCLSVLKKTFPYMELAAVPGIAIPLLQGDCKETNIDIEWLWDVIHLHGEDRTTRIDLDALRLEVSTWFETPSLEKLMSYDGDTTQQLAINWLNRDGKRWRPFLCAAVTVALGVSDQDQEFDENLKKCAIAVECFHKASLIHDDIEDDDDTRYGEKSMHAEHGIPIALNVGDYLIGEGYRMINECTVPADIKQSMMTIAISGHRRLCEGQGLELSWRQEPGYIKKNEILAMFQKKTSPAFDVALRIGAVYSGASQTIIDSLKVYADNIGVAYQINDDLQDAQEDVDGSDLKSDRPSLLLGLIYERATKEEKTLLDAWWQGDEQKKKAVIELSLQSNVQHRMEEMKESFKMAGINALLDLKNASLKGLMRRVSAKLFNDIIVQGWCDEFEAGDDSSGQVSSTSP
ncbi:MAG: polyprenyl synthetase family protein [Planctomycetes bacterium]|nr:polyprenyl synthetase family protein [Planctomycetota bacterium]